MCSEALRRAAAKHHGLDLQGLCLFYTECPDFKRSAIQRVHNGAYANRPPSSFFMFENTASLIEQVAKTVDVNMVDVAVPQILFCGILCKNVSGLTTTPRSALDPNGKSGYHFQSSTTI